VKKVKKILIFAMLAVLAFGSLSFVPNLGKGDTTYERTGAKMRGLITAWGSTPVFGFISAQAAVVNRNGTIHEWARAHAMWSPDMRFNHTEEDDNENRPRTENITSQFYVARLVNTTQVAFNSSGFDLDIKGYWDVVNITQTIEFDAEGEPVNWTRTWTPLVTNATGELGVIAPKFPTPGTFTLTISGIDPLTGIVFRYCVRNFEIEIGDFDGKGKVDIHDLVKVAHSYGTMPGMPGYSEDFDFDFNLKVDIGDLATVAENIEA
jgi:hypothetical protein